MPSAQCWAKTPTRPFHPRDDRIICLSLHRNIDIGIAHDVIIEAWWSSL
jgi:hypothetical protein